MRYNNIPHFLSRPLFICRMYNITFQNTKFVRLLSTEFWDYLFYVQQQYYFRPKIQQYNVLANYLPI